MFKRIVFLCLIIFLPLVSGAALSPSMLRMRLTAETSKYTQGSTFTFWLTFVNEDEGERALLLPSAENKGQKMIFLSFFSVKEGVYTEVFREEREIQMDTTQAGTVHFWYLKAKDSITVPLIFNDSKNYVSHIHSHHTLPNLPIGEYQVLAWYQPWENEMAQYAFNPLDSKGNISDQAYDTTRFLLSEVGIQSNYFTLNIQKESFAKPTWIPTEFCPLDCKMCGAIEKSDWDKVSKMIDHQTGYKNIKDTSNLDTTWEMKHRNVLWLGPNPQMILASLPTYTGRNIIFRNEAGLHYFYLSWQLGQVYKTRSRLSSLFYWIGFRRPPFSTAEVDYCKLIGLYPN